MPLLGSVNPVILFDTFDLNQFEKETKNFWKQFLYSNNEAHNFQGFSSKTVYKCLFTGQLLEEL